MKNFIKDDFLLGGDRAVELYQKYARDLPIIDYHSHLPAADIAADRRFNDLYEIWLAGDHYKWRAMRTNGVDERLCTGLDTSPKEKFLAWARTVPATLRNPLYHWTHLELKRYFGIDELLDETTAEAVWERANARLATPELSVHGILNRFQVRALCTTDDPADDLRWHREIAAFGLATRVYPTFRPDRALGVDNAGTFNEWLTRLEEVSDVEVRSLQDLETALKKRHDYFHGLGCRLSDHGLERAFAAFGADREAGTIFNQVRAGRDADPAQKEKFASYLMLFFGRLDHDRGWTKQLHLGALRNTNTRQYQTLGPDAGFDSIGDWPQAAALGQYLDRLDQENALPRLIIYNINPADFYSFGTMLGNFQDGSAPGKVQLGSGWWFLDQKDGMEWQLNAVSNLGLLSRFVGMLTDSRSFMSFPRHEYFRRVLCNLLGREIEAGELPDEDGLIGPLIENVCYGNAEQYFGFELGK